MSAKKFKVYTAALFISAGMLAKTPPLYANGPGEIHLLTEARFDSMGNLSEGLIWCNSGDSYQYIDTSGRTVIGPFTYSKYFSGERGEIIQVSDFHQGRAYIRSSNGEQVYINKNGVKIFELDQNHSYGGHFSGGMALSFSEDSKDVFVYNLNGRYQKKAVDMGDDVKIQYGPHFLDDYLVIVIYDADVHEDYVMGYINTSFEMVIPPIYEGNRPFNNDRAFVQSNGLWGVIDKSGKEIIPPIYDDFLVTDGEYSYQIFHDDIATVSQNWLWGFVDRDGNVISECVYGRAGHFSMGYATVTQNGRTGYIDAAGEVVVAPQYLLAGPVYEDCALVVLEERNYQIVHVPTNTLSERVWEFDALVVYDENPAYFTYTKNKKEGLGVMSVNKDIAYILEEGEAQGPGLYFMGEPLELNDPVINRQDRGYYPFRALLEAIGAEISFDPETGAAMAALEENTLTISIGSPDYEVNGEMLTMDAIPFIENDKTYVPIRYVCEGFGFTVSWDEKTGATHIAR